MSSSSTPSTMTLVPSSPSASPAAVRAGSSSACVAMVDAGALSSKGAAEGVSALSPGLVAWASLVAPPVVPLCRQRRRRRRPPWRRQRHRRRTQLGRDHLVGRAPLGQRIAGREAFELTGARRIGVGDHGQRGGDAGGSEDGEHLGHAAARTISGVHGELDVGPVASGSTDSRRVDSRSAYDPGPARTEERPVDPHQPVGRCHHPRGRPHAVRARARERRGATTPAIIDGPTGRVVTYAQLDDQRPPPRRRPPGGRARPRARCWRSWRRTARSTAWCSTASRWPAAWSPRSTRPTPRARCTISSSTPGATRLVTIPMFLDTATRGDGRHRGPGAVRPRRGGRRAPARRRCSASRWPSRCRSTSTTSSCSRTPRARPACRRA